MRTTTKIGTAKTRNGTRHEKSDASPAPMSTPAMAPMLISRAVGRVDARADGDRVVVRQERVVRREDHGLAHVDADQHHGDQHDRVGQAEADGERRAHEGADQRDADPVMRSARTATGSVKSEPGGAGDGDDQQDAGVCESERVADVRCQDVEGALGGLVEQLDGEEHAEGEREAPAPSSRRRVTA